MGRYLTQDSSKECELLLVGVRTSSPSKGLNNIYKTFIVQHSPFGSTGLLLFLFLFLYLRCLSFNFTGTSKRTMNFATS